MKVYLKSPPLSQAMERVTKALTRYGTGIRFVDEIEQADLIVLHTVGYPETEVLVREIVERRQKYIIIQYCLRTTQRPSTLDWIVIWKGAEFVWTYYDLEAMYQEDVAALPPDDSILTPTLAKAGIRVYRSPLGVDSGVFQPMPGAERYLIGTSGYVVDSEGALEANRAVHRLGGKQFHLGPPLKELENTFFQNGINDWTLAQLYSQCRYVAGLRRGEGFELPAAEAILCGVRPVCFDRPHYRDWYGPWAVFIPEGTFDEVADALTKVLAQQPEPITEESRAEAAALFNWESICLGFWAHVMVPSESRGVWEPPDVAHRIVGPRARLLWVGDAGCPSGFARATHGILDTLRHAYDVTVLGINYRGDPHDYPYPIFAAAPGGDFMGVGRLPWMCDYVKPDVIVIQNDGWNIPTYVQQLKKYKELAEIPVVAVVAVDGENFCRPWLDGVAHTIFWTKFAEREARRSGFEGSSTVIPLGVDRKIYHPRSRDDARRERGIGAAVGSFIVGSVNRNQPRKRWDLLLRYFSDWVFSKSVLNAYLFLHVAPTGDTGVQVRELAAYYGIFDRLILVEPPTWYGIEDQMLATTYNCFDVMLSTSQGEGFGLTTLEAMSCGIPCVLPQWSALGDWAAKGAYMVPCTSTAIGPPYVNVIGGVMDQCGAVAALDALYRDTTLRMEYRRRALALAQDLRYEWEDIGKQYGRTLHGVVSRAAVMAASGVPA